MMIGKQDPVVEPGAQASTVAGVAALGWLRQAEERGCVKHCQHDAAVRAEEKLDEH